jgi:hypothetical protein
MTYNKIVLEPDNVLLDVSKDTATEGDVVRGKTFHKSNGEQAEGTYIPQPTGIEHPSNFTAGNFASYDENSKELYDTGYSGSDIESLKAAVSMLRDGVDADKIDGIMDLIKYVEEHGPDVEEMKQNIKSNTEAIEKCAEERNASNIESGKGIGSVQFKGGNASGNYSVDFSEPRDTVGEPYSSEYLVANFSNGLSEDEKREKFPVKRVAIQYSSSIGGVKPATNPVMKFGDGSYIVIDNITTYYAADGTVLVRTDDNPDSSQVVYSVDVNTYISESTLPTWMDYNYEYHPVFDSSYDALWTLYGVAQSGALADNTFVTGVGTTATSRGQFVTGMYNIPDANALLIVGNGTQTEPSNLLTVGKDGRVYINGLPESQNTSGYVLVQLPTGEFALQPYRNSNSAYSIIVRDKAHRAYINTPTTDTGGGYHIVNRIYSDTHSGGSTSITIAAGGSKTVKFACTNQNANYSGALRGEYSGIGTYTIYGSTSSVVIKTAKDGNHTIEGSFMILSVSPVETSNNGIRICALKYDGLLNSGWSHIYAELGDTVEFKAGSSQCYIHYHQSSGFRAKFPT